MNNFISIIGKILGVIVTGIFFITVIIIWLGFFGIIPQGSHQDDRYWDEKHAPFN